MRLLIFIIVTRKERLYSWSMSTQSSCLTVFTISGKLKYKMKLKKEAEIQTCFHII